MYRIKSRGLERKRGKGCVGKKVFCLFFADEDWP